MRRVPASDSTVRMRAKEPHPVRAALTRTGVAFTPSTRDTYGFANDLDHGQLGNVLGLLSRASASSARVFLGNYTTSMRSIWEGTRLQLSGMCERRRNPLPPDATCIPGREV